MVTHAFGNNDRISELEWIENKMLFLARAENTLRGPFVRTAMVFTRMFSVMLLGMIVF